MVWSHNDHWMMTGDHAGFVKYWQSNMNNVKMYQAHKDPIRGLRCVIVGKELVTLGQLLVYNFENFIINKIICTWWSMLSNSFHLLILNLQYYLWCTFLNHENFYFFYGNYIKFLLYINYNFASKILQITNMLALISICIVLIWSIACLGS